MEVFQCVCISTYICIRVYIYMYTQTHTRQTKKNTVGPIYSSLLPLAMEKLYDTLYFNAYYNKNIFTRGNTGIIFLFCPWNSYGIFWIRFTFTYNSTWVARHSTPLPVTSISMPKYRLLHMKKCSKRRHLHWMFSYAEYKMISLYFSRYSSKAIVNQPTFTVLLSSLHSFTVCTLFLLAFRKCVLNSKPLHCWISPLEALCTVMFSECTY